MGRSFKPGLFVRISHLIIIQILFIFSALALVFLYSDDEETASQFYEKMEQKISAEAASLMNIISADSSLNVIDQTLFFEADQLLARNHEIERIDLLCRRRGRDTLINLAGAGMTTFELNHNGNSNDPSAPPFLAGIKTEILPVLSRDGKTISYLLRRGDEIGDNALVVTVNNRLPESSQSNQAELLFVLFLISALISLMIINLIFRGFREPLTRLVEAMEKTAQGEERYVVEEDGDKEIRRLSAAYNTMARSMAEKQHKLTAANRELLQSNNALIQSESILTALVDYSPDAIIVTDLDDQVLIYNQQAGRDFGYNQNDMLGRKISNIFSIPRSQKPLADGPVDLHAAKEIICRRRDGSKFPALLVQTPLGPEGCPPIAILHFIKNISESENYQSMILKLDRIASKGKMARDIAHEINNYLAILQGNLELLPMVIAKGDEAKTEQKISLMRETVAKITNFTEGLTKFSDENSEFEKGDLNQLIENLIAFIKPQNRFDEILIGTNLADNIPLVEIDAGQFQHLLLNLIYNAADSLANFDGTRWIIISTSLDESGEAVYIKVADSGPGVDPENIPKLFVTRFSTRRQGNGLGLITCKNVVDNHRGEISYHTSDESQAIFQVRIPVKRPSQKENVPSAPTAQPEALVS
jgi:two-component system sensor kinase FixL